METAHGTHSKSLVCFYEFLGTCFLLYSINMSGGNPLAIGLMLCAWCVIGGGISGGHYNPAVTAGVYIMEGEHAKNGALMLMMIVTQVLGGMFGVLLAFFSMQNIEAYSDHQLKGSVNWDLIPVLCPKDQNPSDISKADPEAKVSGFDASSMPGSCAYFANRGSTTFLIEMLCTFVFISVILANKYKHAQPTKDGYLACVGIGLTLTAMITCAAPWTGGCLNPAVGMAQTTYVCSQLPNHQWHQVYTQYLDVYILAPLTGGILAGLFGKVHEASINSCNKIAAQIEAEAQQNEKGDDQMLKED